MPASYSYDRRPFPKPVLGADLMREIGQLAVRRIRTRTESGRDMHGRPFAPLSESYQKARQKAGVGIGSQSRLTLSGEMLNAMQVTSAGTNTVQIGFVTGDSRPGRGGTMISRSRQTGAQAKAAFAMEGDVRREFFGLSEEDETAIQAAVDRYLDRVLGQ